MQPTIATITCPCGTCFSYEKRSNKVRIYCDACIVERRAADKKRWRQYAAAAPKRKLIRYAGYDPSEKKLTARHYT